MIASTSGSALKPIATARAVRKFAGQVRTIDWMRASGLKTTREATFSPATRLSASIISATVALMPGRLSQRCVPQASLIYLNLFTNFA